MKLLSIRLCNFRQFYGKTPEVILAHSPCNTTVIHGNNGAGKTTLLNAFTWVLYEKFTAAFASPHLLVNKRAITEAEVGASVDCWVEVQFEHDNKRYQVKRKCYACRDREGIIQSSQSKFFMLIAGDDGRWYPPLDPPEDIINRILPESLHQYFFFDGEQIDRLFRSYDKSRIAEDTKELLGVKVLDRAIEHLKKAKRTLQEELEALGDIEIKQLLQQLSEAERESDRLQQRQQDIIQELSQKEDLKKDLTHRLLDMSGAAELKQLKETLEIQEVEKRQHLIEAKRKIKQAISSRSHTVFLPEIIAQFQALINDLRIRGELPSGIKQQFVRQLLENQRCICGGDLLAGSDRYQQVQQWMNRAGMADVEEAAIRLESQVDELTKQGNEFWQEVDRQQSHIQQLRTELATSENQLDDIRQKFRRYPDCDIQSLQNQLDEIEDAFKDLTLEQGANKHQQHVLQKELEGITKQLNKHQLKEQKQSLAQRRIQVTQEAIARLIEVRTRLENQFRLSLEKRVQAIFHSISFTPYIPRIQTNYELSLVENTSGIAVPVAASTGENQILSLSFIGGIIARVREWSQKNTLIGPDSSTFPIVMDSPFGSLDEIYRRRVARSIPQLANQLIVLVTQTQWRIEVEAELSDYIGKEYVLVYNSPKPECEEDAIAIGGETYPLVKPSPNEFEYTEILEVKSRD
jgi:DNA sulfur modification protein DndD